MEEELRGRLIAKLHKDQPVPDGLYRHECVDIVDALVPIIDAELELAVAGQSTLPGATSSTEQVRLRMAVIATALRARRYVYASEAELQGQLATVLAERGMPVRREVRLDHRDRIDLMVGDIGIEVKVKGQRTPISQLLRYSEHDQVGGLLLVTTRAAELEDTVGGKPAAVVSLITNGLA